MTMTKLPTPSIIADDDLNDPVKDDSNASPNDPVKTDSKADPKDSGPTDPKDSGQKDSGPTDPFDIASLRINPSFLETTGVKKLLTTVPIRRPSRQEFFRVHSAEAYRNTFAAIDLRDDREVYIVHPAIAPELAGETIFVTLFTCINRQGTVFLWPVRLPTPEDKKSEWWRSAREAAELAMTRWVRMKANMDLGAYDIGAAESTLSEPEWPKHPFQELVRIGFRDSVITTLDHPVVKRLRGLA
jgi:hypothetical protein